MGEWDENKESRLDKIMDALSTYWGAIAMVIIVLIVGKMEASDQAVAEAMVTMFYSSEPDCEIRSAEHGRASVKVCGAKGKPLTKMID